jgi:hypothetical protein
MILSPIRLSVIRKIEDFMDATGMSPDAFGRAAVGDHKIVPRLRRGLNCNLSRVEALLAYCDAENAKAADTNKAA